MSSDRTEKPTPKKRKKAGEQGDRLMSREPTSAAALLAGTIALGVFARSWGSAWRASFHESLMLAFQSRAAEPQHLAISARSIVVAGLSPIAFVIGAACAAAICLAVFQGGGQIHIQAVAPKLGRLNPLQNAKNLFGQQAAVRLCRSLLPVFGVVMLACRQVHVLASTPTLSLARLPGILTAVYQLMVGASCLMLAWSLIDFLSSWRAREQRLKMSKQDVKDESKETEGSPQIKRRIRSIQRQMRSRKLREDVRKATVVVTNPTHYAVALSFDFEQMTAPKVLAKGRDLVAASMREEARWAGIHIVENPPLARSLYRSVQPGQSIPLELYAAVAGILAYLYRDVVESRMRDAQGQAHLAHLPEAEGPQRAGHSAVPVGRSNADYQHEVAVPEVHQRAEMGPR